MLIAGFQRASLVDYPGQVASVVFTPFCNMNCTYCHNSHIIRGTPPLLDESLVFEHLIKRKGLIHAVVISGGEPTLQQNLIPFIEQVRALSLKVKLDTNGLKPQVLATLIRRGLVDYIAMDVKAPRERYAEIARAPVDFSEIQRSIALLRTGGVPHEFRLTYAPELTEADVVAAARLVEGTALFFLQQYRPRSANDPPAHPPSVVYRTANAVEAAIGVCSVRGLAAV